MNKNGIVDIFGGFGNQIFQFCFANSLKNKNLSITINTRDFERVARENSPLLTARKLVLPVEYFDFDETTNKEFKSYKFKKLIYESKFTKKITNQNIYRSFNDKNYSASEFKKFNRFTGNWQSLNLLNENKDYIETNIDINNIDFANSGASSVVSKKGTLPLDKFFRLTNKVSKDKKEIVGFTNGCFDILHLGHINLLKK